MTSPKMKQECYPLKILLQKNSCPQVKWACVLEKSLYNTNGFGIETMYDYYIAMKSMFLIAKSFYHPSIVYASLTFFLP
jgi:hypothetical protein